MWTAHAQTLLRTLDEHRTQMLNLLDALVSAESPSSVPEAQQVVQDHLTRALLDVDMEVDYLPGRGRSGGHLYARPLHRDRGVPVQLLIGHCDTVWPLGTLETRPFRIEANRATGPGIFDMKGGLVQLIFALKALHVLGLRPAVTPVAFINSDEEIGSLESRIHIERLARSAERAFVMEPALGLEGSLKTSRKATGAFRIEVQGRSAHAGLAPETGASAIVELSYVIQKLNALNDPARGVTVNVGQIDGGLRANVVAPVSHAVVDVRVPTEADAYRIEQAIRSIRAETPGTSVQVEGWFGRPPMESNPRNHTLWEAACTAAAALDLDLTDGMAGGGSDGSFTTVHTATLDGLGAVGDGAHAEHEFIFIDKMIERSALLALLLLLPAPGSASESNEETTEAEKTEAEHVS